MNRWFESNWNSTYSVPASLSLSSIFFNTDNSSSLSLISFLSLTQTLGEREEERNKERKGRRKRVGERVISSLPFNWVHVVLYCHFTWKRDGNKIERAKNLHLYLFLSGSPFFEGNCPYRGREGEKCWKVISFFFSLTWLPFSLFNFSGLFNWVVYQKNRHTFFLSSFSLLSLKRKKGRTF